MILPCVMYLPFSRNWSCVLQVQMNHTWVAAQRSCSKVKVHYGSCVDRNSASCAVKIEISIISNQDNTPQLSVASMIYTSSKNSTEVIWILWHVAWFITISYWPVSSDCSVKEFWWRWIRFQAFIQATKQDGDFISLHNLLLFHSLSTT